MRMKRARWFSAALVLIRVAAAAEWESLPPLPEPSGGSIAGAHGSRIVIVGGTNWKDGTKNWLRAIHEYDPAAKKWETTGSLKDGPVAYGVAFQTKDRDGTILLSFIGGSDGKQPVKAFGGVNGDKTVLIPIKELPDALVLCAGGQLGERDIIVGGTNDAANIAACQRSVHSVEFRDGQWVVTEMAYYPGKPFCVAASAVAGASLHVFGGANWDEKTSSVVNTNEAHAFDALKNEWRNLKPLPFAVRGMAAVALDHEHIYLAGGYRSDPDGFTADAFVFDTKTGDYKPTAPLPYAASAALVSLDGFIYCLGGEDQMKHRTDKCFRIPASELMKSAEKR